jgi:hypothetical protein
MGKDKPKMPVALEKAATIEEIVRVAQKEKVHPAALAAKMDFIVDKREGHRGRPHPMSGTLKPRGEVKKDAKERPRKVDGAPKSHGEVDKSGVRGKPKPAKGTGSTRKNEG